MPPRGNAAVRQAAGGSGRRGASPASRFWGGFRTENGRIDLKRAGLFGIVTAARVLAICHHLLERSTPARLAAIGGLDRGGRRDLDALARAQALFLDLILMQQLADMRGGLPPSNKVAVRRLSREQRARLREALARRPPPRRRSPTICCFEGHLTEQPARGIDRARRATAQFAHAGSAKVAILVLLPPAIDRIAIARQLAETLAFAAVGGLTLGLLGYARRLFVGLDPGGRRRLAGRPADADAGAAGARPAGADRHFARRGGHAGDAATAWRPIR